MKHRNHMSMDQQYCTFQVGGFQFGVDVTKVREVIRDQKMTRVPLAPEEVRGLINLRGQIITAIDLRRRLKMPDRPENEPPINVLVSNGWGAVSFQVDKIEDVLEIETGSIEEPPESLDSDIRCCLKGVSKLKDRLLLLLDESRAMDLAR